MALLQGAEPAYSRQELTEAAREFETTYEAYAEHQRHMERFWCLRWLQQEGIAEAGATLVRDELVRVDGLPLVVRAIGLPTAPPGERVQVAFGEIDLWEAHVIARYAGK